MLKDPLLLTLALSLVAALPSNGQEATIPAIPNSIGLAGAFAGICDGHLVAGGGANFPDGVMPWDGGKKVWHDELFTIDLTQSERQWKTIGKLHASNGYGVSLSVKEGTLFIGGGNANEHFRDTFLLSLSEGKPSWKKLPPLPQPRALMTGAMVGSRIHLYGGTDKPDATTACNDHWSLDLEHPDEGWLILPPLPGAGRIFAVSAGMDGAFIVAGGCGLSPDPSGKATRTYLSDTWKFDGKKWDRLSDMPRAATAAASPAPTSGHSLYVISGDEGKTYSEPSKHPGFTLEVLRYDLVKDQWSVSGRLHAPPPVTLPAIPWKNGFILFNGEVRPGVRTSTNLIFTPPANTP